MYRCLHRNVYACEILVVMFTKRLKYYVIFFASRKNHQMISKIMLRFVLKTTMDYSLKIVQLLWYNVDIHFLAKLDRISPSKYEKRTSLKLYETFHSEQSTKYDYTNGPSEEQSPWSRGEHGVVLLYAGYVTPTWQIKSTLSQ